MTPGIDRTVARVNLKYTWYGRHKDIRNYINSCKICQVCMDLGRKPKMEMGQLTASRPLELVFLDFVTLDCYFSSDGRVSVLVITDAYTKFTKEVQKRNQLTVTVAKVLMNEWIFNYGTPRRIHTDQGRNWQAEIVAELCRLFGSKQSRTTPYHTQVNGHCERVNRSLKT